MPEFAEPLWLLGLLGLPLAVWARWRAALLEEPFKRTLGTALRCVAFAALLMALAGPLKRGVSDRTDLMFALDVSSSIDREAERAALTMINQALREKPADTRAGLVVFGEQAATELLLREGVKPLEEISVEVNRGATNIARGMELALSAFSAEANRRIVLFSDGQENAGEARATAAVARTIGVEILTVPMTRTVSAAEVALTDMRAAPWVRAYEPFEVEMSIDSTTRTRAHLVITRNSVPLTDAWVELEPGTNIISLPEQLDAPGLYEYEAVLNSDADQVTENNRYQVFVQARGEPRVLHALGSPEVGRFVSAALRAQGIDVVEVEAKSLPGSLHEMADYDLVLLNNVSGFDLSMSRMEVLEDYVRDAGGGVMVIGGDKSYSAGGYYGTPVERLLPVTMDVKTEAKIPTLAVTIVIDRSGSMSSEGKLVIAKAAAMAAVEVLNPLDQVSVLAFDDEPEWSVAPSEVGDRQAIVEQLRMVASGGGTDLFAALEEAERVMAEQSARVKHIIVLSDGLTETDEDFDGLVGRLRGSGITLSTVAFGSDSDRALMERIAALGQGRHYFTDNPRNIPRIFTSETLVVSRDLLVEKRVRASLEYPGEIVAGFEPGDFPAIDGYQRIFAKPAAQILLGAADDDPLLVSWRYGLGKSVAFTSDLAGQWAPDWIEWPQFSRFMAQAARWTMRRRGTERMLPQFSWDATRAKVDIDVLDRNDAFVNGLRMRAQVTSPGTQAQNIELEQIAPGRYSGDFAVPGAGRYYLSVSGEAAGVAVGPRLFGLAVPYSSEYLQLGTDRELLADVADTTGGELVALSNQSLPRVLAAATDTASHKDRIWLPFALAALICVLLEIAVRKVRLPDSWLSTLDRLLKRRSRQLQPEPGYEALVTQIDEIRAAHLAALRDGRRYEANDPSSRARLYVSRNRR